MQDKVDALEEEKNSHINKVADLRALLKKVNLDGEKRVTFIKNKNVSHFINLTKHSYSQSLRTELQQ